MACASNSCEHDVVVIVATQAELSPGSGTTLDGVGAFETLLDELRGTGGLMDKAFVTI